MRKVYLIICIGITAGFIALAAFPFRISYLRLWESMKDLGVSFAYYFCDVFKIENSIKPTVIFRSELFQSVIPPSTDTPVIPSVPNAPPSADLPSDYTGFKEKVRLFFSLFFSRSNFRKWLVKLLLVVMKGVLYITFCAMVLVMIWAVFKFLYGRRTLRRRDTFPLKIFKLISGVSYQPIKKFIGGFMEYVKEQDKLRKLWITIWILNLNVVTIVTAFFAYAFYIVVSFKLSSVYVQCLKLADDMQVLFHNFPWWSIATGAWVFFNRWRTNKGTDRLRHMGAMNMGYIKSLPIVNLICGLMGSGKTRLMASMIRYMVVIERQWALDILIKTDMEFPYFPWVKFEDELRANMDSGEVYNLATAGEWVKTKCGKIETKKDLKRELYDYDYKRYGLEFDDGIKRISIFKAMETYAKAYFVYVMSSSLAVCNFSLRTNELKIDSGNLPMWVQDFFVEGIVEERRAHVMDWEAFRLFRRMNEDSPKFGSFEFGVVGVTEIGKERGNSLELQDVKKTANETNQKNDGFNAWLKMCRHSATIDNVPFIKVFADEQRPESWGADARDLAAVLHVGESSEVRVALPFYTIGNMLSEWAFSAFKGLYLRFRHKRGDNTLLVHILKSITAFIWKRDMRIYNKFGYKVMAIEQEKGTLDGKREVHPYYLIFSQVDDTYCTDCFGDYFKDLALETNVSLADWREYAAERASAEEMAEMNSYFIGDLYGL